MKLTKLSWADIEKTVDDLGEKVKASGFAADYIIGITTGGLIPLALLAKKLQIDNMLTVSASSYEKDKQKELTISYLPEIDLAGKKILLVDEIAESGTTLQKIVDTMKEKYHPAELKTATLAANTDKCKFWPDFWVVEEKGGWVVFHWEKEEFPEYF